MCVKIEYQDTEVQFQVQFKWGLVDVRDAKLHNPAMGWWVNIRNDFFLKHNFGKIANYTICTVNKKPPWAWNPRKRKGILKSTDSPSYSLDFVSDWFVCDLPLSVFPSRWASLKGQIRTARPWRRPSSNPRRPLKLRSKREPPLQLFQRTGIIVTFPNK